MNIEKLQMEIDEVIEDLNKLGANIDTSEVSLSASDDEGDADGDMKALKGLMTRLTKLKGEQSAKAKTASKAKAKAAEDEEPDLELPDEAKSLTIGERVNAFLGDVYAELDDSEVEEALEGKNKAVENKIKSQLSKEQVTAATKYRVPFIYMLLAANEFDEPINGKYEKLLAKAFDAVEEAEQAQDNERGKTTKKVIDTDLEIEDEAKVQRVDASAVAPVNLTTKLSANVKVVDNSEVEEYYSLVLKLHAKLEALESVFDEDDALMVKLMTKTHAAYNTAVEKLEDLADDSFPKKLDQFGDKAKNAVIEMLRSVDAVGKKTYRFDTKNAKFSRFIRIDDDTLSYSYSLMLKSVKDAEGFVFKDYIVVVTQKLHWAEGEREAGKPPTPKYYVTRLLRDTLNYQPGTEFKTEADLKNRLAKILSYDNIHAEVDRIQIPFTRGELSKRFISDHVKLVKIDDQRHKIIVQLKPDATEDDANLLVPDFMKQMAEVVNQKKIALKYAITKRSAGYAIEFILLHKAKDSGAVNRHQIEDMRDRYDLSDQAYRSLLKFFVVGN